jgi:hypothetical protein
MITSRMMGTFLQDERSRKKCSNSWAIERVVLQRPLPVGKEQGRMSVVEHAKSIIAIEGRIEEGRHSGAPLTFVQFRAL